MIKKFEDIINEFQKLGYIYHYFPNSHIFKLLNPKDDDGWVIDSINIDYKNNFIRFNGAFGKKELDLIKKIIERLEKK